MHTRSCEYMWNPPGPHFMALATLPSLYLPWVLGYFD